MYGFTEQAGGGGLAAVAPLSAPAASGLIIRSPGSMVIGNQAQRGGAPGMTIGAMGSMGGPPVAPGGGAVTTNPSNQLSSWRQILDFHNSPAPWILLMLLFVYGYVHISYRKGRLHAGGGL